MPMAVHLRLEATGTTRCPKCGVVKLRTEFSSRQQLSTNGTYYLAYNAYCKPCSSKAMKDYHAANPEKKALQIRKHALRRYGLTLDDYDRILRGQGGACAICGTREPGGKKGRFTVDHCHESGKIRGLLCINC